MASLRASSTCAGSRRCRSRTSLREANATGRVLVVDETRRTGGVSEGIVAALVDARVRRADRARRERGLVHPARRCGEPRARLRERRRAGRVEARRGARLIRIVLAVLAAAVLGLGGGDHLVVGSDARGRQRGAREGRGAAARRLARLGEGVRAGRQADPAVGQRRPAGAADAPRAGGEGHGRGGRAPAGLARLGARLEPHASG